MHPCSPNVGSNNSRSSASYFSHPLYDCMSINFSTRMSNYLYDSISMYQKHMKVVMHLAGGTTPVGCNKGMHSSDAQRMPSFEMLSLASITCYFLMHVTHVTHMLTLDIHRLHSVRISFLAPFLISYSLSLSRFSVLIPSSNIVDCIELPTRTFSFHCSSFVHLPSQHPPPSRIASSCSARQILHSRLPSKATQLHSYPICWSISCLAFMENIAHFSMEFSFLFSYQCKLT